MYPFCVLFWRYFITIEAEIATQYYLYFVFSECAVDKKLEVPPDIVITGVVQKLCDYFKVSSPLPRAGVMTGMVQELCGYESEKAGAVLECNEYSANGRDAVREVLSACQTLYFTSLEYTKFEM